MYLLTGSFLKVSLFGVHRVGCRRLRYIRPSTMTKVTCTTQPGGHMYFERVMYIMDLRKAPPEHYKGTRSKAL